LKFTHPPDSAAKEERVLVCNTSFNPGFALIKAGNTEAQLVVLKIHAHTEWVEYRKRLAVLESCLELLFLIAGGQMIIEVHQGNYRFLWGEATMSPARRSPTNCGVATSNQIILWELVREALKMMPRFRLINLEPQENRRSSRPMYTFPG